MRCKVKMKLYFQDVKANACGFKYYSSAIFYKPTCGVTARGLLLFRVLALFFHCIILLIRMTEPERLPPFCYLTNIVYLCCAIYYAVAVYNSLYLRDDMDTSPRKLFQSPQVFRMDKVCYEEKTSDIQLSCVLQWLLHAMILNLSILVSIMYFSLVYDPAVDRLGLTNIGRHVFNSVFILIEFSLNSIPVKLVHVIWGVIFSLIYALYTVIFWFVVAPPENYIYKMINWDKPSSTIRLIFILLFAAILIKLVLSMLSKLKFHFSDTYKSSHDETFLV